MLLIPTEIRTSKIHGLGLFALVDVKTNLQISQFAENFDRKFSQIEYSTLDDHALRFLWAYGYHDLKDNMWRLNIDNIRFMNHSDQANTYQDGDDDFAVRTIHAGEEITCDYFSFDKEAARKLGR